MQNRINPTDDALSADELADITGFFRSAQRLCEQNGLDTAFADTVHVIGSPQGDAPVALPESMTKREAAFRLDHFEEALHYDMRTRTVEVIPAAQSGFYGASFGVEVETAFSSATEDSREANTCYALGRNRAAVFHAVRATEWGLKALARAAGVTGRIDYKEWGKIINGIEQKVAVVDRWRTGPEKSNALDFYRGSLADARAINNCRRTTNLHVKVGVPCTAHDANGAISHAREFLRRLATRVSEPQRRRLSKRSFST